MYKSEKWEDIGLSKREDGTGILKGNISKSDIYFFLIILLLLVKKLLL